MEHPKSNPDPACPMAQLLETLAGKWAFRVLYRLLVAGEPQRFGELHRAIDRITQKELTKYLREFEALGLVSRSVFAEVPPRVEYQVTEYGQSLRRPLDELVRWSAEHGAPLFEARRRLLASRRFAAEASAVLSTARDDPDHPGAGHAVVRQAPPR